MGVPVITIQPLTGIVETGCYSQSIKCPRAVEVSVAFSTTHRRPWKHCAIALLSPNVSAIGPLIRNFMLVKRRKKGCEEVRLKSKCCR